MVWASQEALLIVTNIEPNKTIDVSDLTTCPVIQNSNDPPINDKSKPTFWLTEQIKWLVVNELNWIYVFARVEEEEGL